MVTSSDREKLIDQASRMMAAGWRGNPNMSGDDRDFMHPGQRRRHDDQVRAVVEFVLSESAKQKEAGWRDIASAPTEGDFLIYQPDAEEQFVVFRKGDEFIAFSDKGIEIDVDGATHWRPLPEPPSALLSAGGEDV